MPKQQTTVGDKIIRRQQKKKKKSTRYWPADRAVSVRRQRRRWVDGWVEVGGGGVGAYGQRHGAQNKSQRVRM